MFRRFRVSRTTDFDVHKRCARAEAPEIETLELSGEGPFRGEIAIFPFERTGEGSRLVFSATRPEMVAAARATSSVRMIIAGTCTFHAFCGPHERTIRGNRATFFLPAREMRVRIGPGHFIGIRIPRPRLQAALDLFECDHDLGAVLDAVCFEPQLHGFGRFSERVLQFASDLDGGPDEIVDLVEFRRAKEQLLRLRVAQLLARAAVPERRRRTGSSSLALARAVEYIRAHADRTFDPASMAYEAGLSIRSLQLLFRREFDCTIVQFVLRQRLANARDRLGRGDPDTTVGAIARACGFHHLGEFSRAYKDAFGELPRQTLHNARRWVPPASGTR